MTGGGAVSLQKSGQWQGKLQVNGRRVSVYGRTEAEAKRKLAELKKSALRQGGLPDNCTLQELLQRWLEAENQRWKPRTLADYEHIVFDVIGPELGHVKLSKLRPDQLQTFYSKVGRTNSRLPSYSHAVLHRGLRVAVMWGLLPGNPADKVTRPVQRTKKPILWTPEQARMFLSATRHTWLGPLFETALHTGCRPGELIALRWSDVDLSEGTIRVQRTRQKIGREWVETTPKTASGTRTLTISAALRSALIRQRAKQEAQMALLGPEWKGDGLVFTRANGSQMSDSTIVHALHREADKLGIPRIGPHKLRHLSASLALQNGVPLPMVSRRLGHAGVQITAQVYSHLLTDDQQASDTLERVLC